MKRTISFFLTILLLIGMLPTIAAAKPDFDLGGVTDVMSKAYQKGTKAPTFAMLENKYKEYFGGDDYAMMSGYSLTLDGYRYNIDHLVYPTNEYFLVTAEGDGNFTGHYYLYISSELGGSYEWEFYGYSPNESDFWADGTTALTDTHLTQTQINGTSTQQQLEIATVRVNEFRTKALLFLKRVLVDMGVDCEFYDLGFNKNYFDGYSCGDNHFYTDYVSNNDATSQKDGTKTATCLACGQPRSMYDLGTRIKAPLCDLIAALKAKGSVDLYNRPGVVIPADDQKCYMASVSQGVTGEYVDITIYDELLYTYTLRIASDSAPHQWFLETTQLNYDISTYGYLNSSTNINTSAVLEREPSSESIKKLAISTATELRTEAIAVLDLVLSLYGLNYNFSDYGINEKYFCLRSHSFVDYVYDYNSTATLDGTKTAACKNCGIKKTVIAEGTMGGDNKKTPFNTVAEFLMLTHPSDYTATATLRNNELGAEIEHSVAYNKKYDVLTTKIVTTYDGKVVEYSFDIPRTPNGNFGCRITGKYSNSSALQLDVSATFPKTVSGQYTVTYFKGSDDDKIGLNESLSIFTSIAVSLFYGVAEGLDPALTLADFGFDKHFMCDKGHNLVDAVYNNDATYEKDGTQTGICYFCKEKLTIDAPGTKLVKIVDSSKVFRDVKNKWYKKAVDYCYSHGFMAGVENTRFGLNEPVTRGMFITVLARIAGVDTGKDANKTVTKFNDVKYGKYYTNAIRWASNNGIVNGISKTQFGPEQNITREQICVMLVNFANYLDVEITPRSNPVSFMDSSKISSWAKDAVRTCQKGEIVSGSEQNGRMYFNPKANATRAEAAQMLYKFHNTFLNIYAK